MLKLNRSDATHIDLLRRRYPKKDEYINKNLKFFEDKISSIVKAFLSIEDELRPRVINILFNNYYETISYCPNPLIKLSFLDAIKKSFENYIKNLDKIRKSPLLQKDSFNYDTIRLINTYMHGETNYDLNTLLQVEIYNTNLWRQYIEQLTNHEDTFNRLMLKNILILLCTDLELYENYVEKGYFDRKEVYKF